MERCYYDKFCEYVDLAQKKADEFKKEYEAFKTEFFTDDVKKMLDSLNRTVTWFPQDGGDKIRLTKTLITVGSSHDIRPMSVSSLLTSKQFLDKPYEEIDSELSWFIDRHKEKHGYFEYVVSHAQDILAKLGHDYEALTNSRFVKMQKFDDFFGANDNKVKHIKVTVEWEG